jgi:hypothetical protein
VQQRCSTWRAFELLGLVLFRRLPSRLASIGRPAVSMAPGRLPVRTPSVRRPNGAARPASARPRWIKADRLHALIPRTSPRWKKLYRQRGSVERENGWLKHEWALLPLRLRRIELRLRRIERVRLHADLTVLARLACALANARAPLAA